jgi:hypothetical protein
MLNTRTTQTNSISYVNSIKRLGVNVWVQFALPRRRWSLPRRDRAYLAARTPLRFPWIPLRSLVYPDYRLGFVAYRAAMSVARLTPVSQLLLADPGGAQCGRGANRSERPGEGGAPFPLPLAPGGRGDLKEAIYDRGQYISGRSLKPRWTLCASRSPRGRRNGHSNPIQGRIDHRTAVRFIGPIHRTILPMPSPGGARRDVFDNKVGGIRNSYRVRETAGIE